MRTRDLAVWIAVALSMYGARARAQAPSDEPPPPAPPPAEQQWAPPLPQQPPPAEPPVTYTPATPAQPPAGAGQDQRVEEVAEPESTMRIYGFAMLDGGYDFGKIGDPAWFDTLRPTKLEAFPDEFGKGGRTFAGVRQTRFGVDDKIPTDHGDITTKFEFEMFGVGADAGQTTIRLRHAYGVWKGLRAGQTWSPFMDPDVFPDSIEYWGPPGMPFYRNVQLAYMFYDKDGSDVTVALERPGASADSEPITDRFDLTNVVPRFPAPDVSADVKLACSWGYVRAAGIFRYMRWDDLAPSPIVEGHVYGWGANASANVKIAPALLKLQVVYGSAIENYMNDAPADVGPKNDPAVINSAEGTGLPVFGLTAFADFKWSDYLSSTAGYSYVWIDNSDGQAPDAFHTGHYALGNLLVHPTKEMFLGPEFQWGRRTNHSDGFAVNDYRIQFSVKYIFEHTIGPR